ncbi:LOW QUALITY PROTEIN: putative G-protein coupled receptor 25 [Crocuta crocuta]
MHPTKPRSPSPGTTAWDYSGSGDLEELEPCPAPDLPYGYAYIPALYLAAFVVGLLGNALPLGVTLVCYCRISCRLRRPPHLGRARRNSLRIIFAVEGAFVGSWLPFGALRALFHLARLGALPLPCGLLLALRWGLSIATCLAFVNSCANPLIYLLLDRSFRARAWRGVCVRAHRPARRGSSASSLSRDDSSVFRSPGGGWERARTAKGGSAVL